MKGDDRRLDARSIALGTVRGESNGPHFHHQPPRTAMQAAVRRTEHNYLRLLSRRVQQMCDRNATCSRRPRFNMTPPLGTMRRVQLPQRTYTEYINITDPHNSRSSNWLFSEDFVHQNSVFLVSLDYWINRVPAAQIRIQSPVFHGTRRSYHSTPRVAPIFNMQIVHSHVFKLFITRTMPWTTSWAIFSRSLYNPFLLLSVSPPYTDTWLSTILRHTITYSFLAVHNNSTHHHLQPSDCPQ
jgi:hypothetical protein